MRRHPLRNPRRPLRNRPAGTRLRRYKSQPGLADGASLPRRPGPWSLGAALSLALRAAFGCANGQSCPFVLDGPLAGLIRLTFIGFERDPGCQPRVESFQTAKKPYRQRFSAQPSGHSVNPLYAAEHGQSDQIRPEGASHGRRAFASGQGQIGRTADLHSRRLPAG
jgi:hypothetical protein